MAVLDKLQLMDYSLIVAIIEVDDAAYDDERRDQFFPQLDRFDAEQPCKTPGRDVTLTSL